MRSVGQPGRKVESDGGLETSVPSSSLSVLRWRLAKRSMPISDPWPLRMARMATRSIHHCGKRIPRRIRQSGKALRKLIRSVEAEGFVKRQPLLVPDQFSLSPDRVFKRRGQGDDASSSVTTAQGLDTGKVGWDRLLMGSEPTGARPVDQEADGKFRATGR
jgi:hypothetical protein